MIEDIQEKLKKLEKLVGGRYGNPDTATQHSPTAEAKANQMPTVGEGKSFVDTIKKGIALMAGEGFSVTVDELCDPGFAWSKLHSKMCLKFHPDRRGGDGEDMQMINDVNDFVKRFVGNEEGKAVVDFVKETSVLIEQGVFVLSGIDGLDDMANQKQTGNSDDKNSGIFSSDSDSDS